MSNHELDGIIESGYTTNFGLGGLPYPREQEISDCSGELLNHEGYLIRIWFDDEADYYKARITNIPNWAEVKFFGKEPDSLKQTIERCINLQISNRESFNELGKTAHEAEYAR